MNERIAERIRMLRLQKGLSQQNIADELNLTVAAYSNIERGITGINLQRLYELSEVFDISVAELLDKDQTVSDSNFFENNHTTSVQLSILTQQLSILQQQVNALQAEMFALKSKFN